MSHPQTEVLFLHSKGAEPSQCTRFLCHDFGERLRQLLIWQILLNFITPELSSWTSVNFITTAWNMTELLRFQNLVLCNDQVFGCAFVFVILTSPNAPFPMTLSGSKSSTPSLDRFNRRNSVSLMACCWRFSSFWASGMASSFRESSSLWSLKRVKC